MLTAKHKTNIRKNNAELKKKLRITSNIDGREEIIKNINHNDHILSLSFSDVENLPTLGKLLDIIHKDVEEEANRYQNDYNKSDTDLKRLALKEAFLEYYNNLNNTNTVNVPIVDFSGDTTLKRDNKKIENAPYNFAPNKNTIYTIWMNKLNRYIRDNQLNKNEYDEAAQRGIPQGGAFEKQLDRYRKEIMQKLWQDYYQQRKEQWKTV